VPVVHIAALHGCTVVTEEASSAKKPCIPNVCDHYGVKHGTFLELTRLEEWTC
jgi:hypothetical protein